ncbi:Protein of unknown function [Halogranum amylolyticum]|uniref:DUF1214 domain-containing protein n=1 Tax=Halogranum amylolyticum TaxID=660520 RepID=A0A1H8VBN7_9EURY|nr:DUF1214 domain-containing protein [Halogranum amylolyticum]SEP12880.1 Protein of unknown function [Halogranum amylolyticum]
MRNETHETTADVESNFELLQTTRRSALRGVGLAGLLAMGGGASAHDAAPETPVHRAQQQETENEDSVPVDYTNYVRAQTDRYFESYAELGGFGVFYHYRTPVPVDEQVVAVEHRDVLPSVGIFDLTEPVTITKPDTGDRYQSLHVVNQDAYTKAVIYEPGEYTLTREQMETRYVQVRFRTFVDPTDQGDIERVQELQDRITVSQSSSGTLALPDWEQDSLDVITEALKTIANTRSRMPEYSFGDEGGVDPVQFFIGSGIWGALPASENFFFYESPPQNDGDTPYTLTFEDVPADAFWDISVYNNDLYFEENQYDAYSLNSENAKRNVDGSVTIHFGGDPNQPNFLYTPAGWVYYVRLYKPHDEVLYGFYQFPKAEPVE